MATAKSTTLQSESHDRNFLDKNNKTQGGGLSVKRCIYVFVPLVAFVLANLLSPVVLYTILQAYQTSDYYTSSRQKKTNSMRSPSARLMTSLNLSNEEKIMLEKLTTKISSSGLPQKVPNTTGGFIHVGKTGGSTLTSVLRNGCHSNFKRPCQVVPNESIVSKTVTYYHVPDWHLLAKEPHDYYIWTLRDPYARTVSAFLYQHPYNVYIRKNQYKEKTYNFPMKKIYPIYNRCFKTLDRFAQALKHQYPRHNYIRLYEANTLKCEVVANAMFQHKAEKLNLHLHYDFRLFRHKIPNTTEPQEKAFFAIRTEFLWQDWVTINELLGQEPGTVVSNEKFQLRNTTKYKLPVKATIGETEREYLCKSIEPEYQAYLDLLSRAMNLDQKDVDEMKELARTNCPKLEILQ